MTMRGHKATKIHRMRLSYSHRGQIPWNKGVPRSEETKRKISLSLSGRKVPRKLVEKRIRSRAWYKHDTNTKNKMSISQIERWGYGNRPNYDANHHWLKNQFGKAIKCDNDECIFKSPKRFEWANISGYHKRDRKDYLQLCPSCHRKWDLGLIIIKCK